MADLRDRAVLRRGSSAAGLLESRWGHVCLSVVSDVFFQVEVFASGCSVVRVCLSVIVKAG
jgi:hypothetical protein